MIGGERINNLSKFEWTNNHRKHEGIFLVKHMVYGEPEASKSQNQSNRIP